MRYNLRYCSMINSRTLSNNMALANSLKFFLYTYNMSTADTQDTTTAQLLSEINESFKKKSTEELTSFAVEAKRDDSEEQHVARIQKEPGYAKDVMTASCVTYDQSAAKKILNIIRDSKRDGAGEASQEGPSDHSAVDNVAPKETGLEPSTLEQVPWMENAIQAGEIVIKGVGIISIGGIAAAVVAIAPFALALVAIVGGIVHHAMDIFDKSLENGSLNNLVATIKGGTIEDINDKLDSITLDDNVFGENTKTASGNNLSQCPLPQLAAAFQQLNAKGLDKAKVADIMKLIIPMFTDIPKDELQRFLASFEEDVTNGKKAVDGLAELSALYNKHAAQKVTKVCLNPLKQLWKDNSADLLAQFGGLLQRSMTNAKDYFANNPPGAQSGGAPERALYEETKLIGHTCKLFANFLKKRGKSIFQRTNCNDMINSELNPCMETVMINIRHINNLVLGGNKSISDPQQDLLRKLDILKMRYLKMVTKYPKDEQCLQTCLWKFTPGVMRCKIVRFQDKFAKLNEMFQKEFEGPLNTALQKTVSGGGKLSRRGVKYTSLSLKELKALAKERGVPGRSKLKTKEEFISALRNNKKAKKDKKVRGYITAIRLANVATKSNCGAVVTGATYGVMQ